nr:DNA polymerase III subunit gamma/tau [uncultured Fretibacterium sp.]
MGVSLYRRYRPQRFSEVSGQAAAIEILTRSLAGSRVGHAYLFSGPRGCGKTTVARILAKALNCLSPEAGEPCCGCRSCQAIAGGESLDVVEIDGASNNSVDEIRELKTHVALAPFSSNYKVYIIDEVHMLSMAAFNALLKTLEEPPSYVVFVLATTEPHKVPVTIRSRCQHIPFHSIGTRRIFDRLRQVVEWEGADAQPEALWEVARQADGALRDALSMLEQVVNRGDGHVRLEDVEATLGGGSRPALERWFAALRAQESASFSDMQRMMAEGASPERILEELFSLVRNLWLVARWPDVLDSLDVSEQERGFLESESPHWPEAVLRGLMSRLVSLIGQSRMGLRSDVLIGLLMLEAVRATAPEAEPERPAVPGSPSTTSRKGMEMPVAMPEPVSPVPAEPAVPKEPAPPASAPSAVPEEGGEGAEVLPQADWTPLPQEACEELLVLAHHRDFVLFCALLDGEFLGSEGRLLLDLPHRYVYEVLSLSRHRSALADLFSRYGGGVFLRCGAAVAACSPSVGGEAGEGAPEEAESAESVAPPPEDREIPQDGVSALPFDGLVREVSRLMNGEVVLVRRGLDESDGGVVPDEDKDDE